MKFKKIFVAVVAAVLISLGLSAPVGAEGNNQNAPISEKRAKKDFLETLNLSVEQKELIKKDRAKSKQNWAELREKLGAKRSELKQELEKPSVDMNKINAIITETKTLTGKMLELRVNNILTMKQILTPEQFKKLQEERAKHEELSPHKARK